MSNAKFEKDIYFEIVDEQSHALSEAFDLPHDIDCLKSDLLDVGPGTVVIRVRPVTEYEIKAYGIKNPEDAFVLLMLGRGDDALIRQVVDNSSGLYDCFLNSDIATRSSDENLDEEEEEEEESFGCEVANYIGTCQGRDGYEFRDNFLWMKLGQRSECTTICVKVRQIIHACLLQPTVDLQRVANEIDRAVDLIPDTLDERLLDFTVTNETLADLVEALDQSEIFVDVKTAARWIEFCGKRSQWFDRPGSSQQYAYLYVPIFTEIDEALIDHRFFSALINGPKDWGKHLS